MNYREARLQDTHKESIVEDQEGEEKVQVSQGK